MKTIAFVLAVLFVGGCASAPLTSEEKAVKVLRHSDAPANCSEVGKVECSVFVSMKVEGREDCLRSKASKLGGNLVVIDRSTDDGLFGTAYKCP